MRLIATDGVTWSVGLSVDHEHCKSAESMDRKDPSKRCRDGDLTVFKMAAVTVQYLVEIDVVLSIICKF